MEEAAAADVPLRLCGAPACRIDGFLNVRIRNEAFAERFPEVTHLAGLCAQLNAPRDVLYRLGTASLVRRMQVERLPEAIVRLVPAPEGGSYVAVETRALPPLPALPLSETPVASAAPPSDTELQFAQSQKMQAVGQLAGGIAHDFNNILTAVLGFCDLLLLRHDIHDPSFSEIEQIRQNALRGADLVRQLLAFSRRQTLLPQVLSLNDVLHDLAGTLPRLLGGGVRLETRYAGDLPPVKIDRSQFEQVILNLAVNARDAMAEFGSGGTLTLMTESVSAEEAGRSGHELLPAAPFVRFSVRDTGPGIPPEIAGQIFEPFFTTKEQGKGTGLGLSTVYGIVKQSGGYIFAGSAPAGGALFEIYLPPAQEAVPAPTASVAPAADLSGRGHILLVEDEPAVRTFVVRALETRGYQVHTAESADEALACLGREPIDLLISDVVMPGVDGPTLVRRARETRPGLKVIFISGYAEDAFRKHLRGDETFVFLPKPFSLRQLSETVKRVIDASGG